MPWPTAAIRSRNAPSKTSSHLLLPRLLHRLHRLLRHPLRKRRKLLVLAPAPAPAPGYTAVFYPRARGGNLHAASQRIAAGAVADSGFSLDGPSPEGQLAYLKTATFARLCRANCRHAAPLHDVP